MKTIVAGSRNGISPLQVSLCLDEIMRHGHEFTEVVCGDCRGVDCHGAKWARFNRIPIRHMPANWHDNGRSAGPIRNQAMADYADALVLIWDGKSRGSADMLRKAKAAGLKIMECIVE